MQQPPPTSPPAAAPRRLSTEELAEIALGRDPERMTLSQLYLRVDGRISRRTFWLHGVLTLLVVGLFGNALLDIAGLSVDLNDRLVNLLLAWPLIAVSAKRLHDFNRTAWWMLVNLLPGVGSMVMLLVNGCVPGTHGPNRYGSEPVDASSRRALNSAH